MDNKDALLRQALALAMITVAYNIIEGVISVGFGLHDETIALFGFGLDSFIEVISGAGIWHMILRMRRSTPADSEPALLSQQPMDIDRFERDALRITGAAFYILALGLALSSAYNLYRGHSPVSTLSGVIVSAISLITMQVLVRMKLRVGHALGSDAIIADARCTRACMQLSGILLASSLIEMVFHLQGTDSIGAILIAWLSFKEGREAFDKARGKACSCAGACATKK